MDSETVSQGGNAQEMFALRKKPGAKALPCANDEIFSLQESQRRH